MSDDTRKTGDQSMGVAEEIPDAVIVSYGVRAERNCCPSHGLTPCWNMMGLTGWLEASAPVPVVILGTKTCSVLELWYRVVGTPVTLPS